MPAEQVTFPSHFFDKVAAAARERGQGWQLLAACLQEPTASFVARLRDGSWAQSVGESAAWLGDDQHMLTSELMSLGVYSRGAVRRDAQTDLDNLVADYQATVGEQPQLVAAFAELAKLCEAESTAWEGRDIAQGKSLRAQQNEFIDAQVATDLVELCVKMEAQASLNIMRTLAKLILAYLSADTGKDYQRAALGSKRKSGGLVDEKGFLRLYEQT